MIFGWGKNEVYMQLSYLVAGVHVFSFFRPMIFFVLHQSYMFFW